MTRPIYLIALLILSTVTAPLAAQTATDAKIMAEAPFKLVAIASDRNLNEMRFACAAGEAPNLEAKAKADGNMHADPHAVCLAVLKEAAIKRPNTMHLYSDLQPNRAFEEWQLIGAAAGKNLTKYVNVASKIKNLTCELALDAGYVYGIRNRQQSIAPEMSDADALKSADDCYNRKAQVGTRTALTAGARIAQMHAK